MRKNILFNLIFILALFIAPSICSQINGELIDDEWETVRINNSDIQLLYTIDGWTAWSSSEGNYDSDSFGSYWLCIQDAKAVGQYNSGTNQYYISYIEFDSYITGTSWYWHFDLKIEILDPWDFDPKESTYPSFSTPGTSWTYYDYTWQRYYSTAYSQLVITIWAINVFNTIKATAVSYSWL